MDDYGIKTSIPGSDAIVATGTLLNFSSANPFIKIDTQTSTGFQTITLLITTDPPEPVFPVLNTFTTVYQFKHGYSYTPSLETLFFVQSAPPGTHFTQTFFLDAGQIAAQTADDGVILYAIADKTNVYFVVGKYNDGTGSANLLTGTTVQITVHVFVEDIGV